MEKMHLSMVIFNSYVSHYQWVNHPLNPMENHYFKNISQLGWLFPIYWETKHVPNHQPDIYIYRYPMVNQLETDHFPSLRPASVTSLASFGGSQLRLPPISKASSRDEPRKARSASGGAETMGFNRFWWFCDDLPMENDGKMMKNGHWSIDFDGLWCLNGPLIDGIMVAKWTMSGPLISIVYGSLAIQHCGFPMATLNHQRVIT